MMADTATLRAAAGQKIEEEKTNLDKSVKQRSPSKMSTS